MVGRAICPLKFKYVNFGININKLLHSYFHNTVIVIDIWIYFRWLSQCSIIIDMRDVTGWFYFIYTLHVYIAFLVQGSGGEQIWERIDIPWDGHIQWMVQVVCFDISRWYLSMKVKARNWFEHFHIQNTLRSLQKCAWNYIRYLKSIHYVRSYKKSFIVEILLIKHRLTWFFCCVWCVGN